MRWKVRVSCVVRVFVYCLDLTDMESPTMCTVLVQYLVVWLDPGNGMSVPFREHKGRKKISQLVLL
ncbi:hypothetical protein QYF61_016917 [Mycteria americana]|uniref:Secreted protein n=1 Tax=Mycteria americana TaxID=33587 RepID=A0AAN7RQ82_MYCAM|nr:hypothetical protein QYF61_016917 [Mycteria americana]